MPASSQPVVGSTSFGAFRAVELLCRGGGGEVWSARRAGTKSADLVIKRANAVGGPLAAALEREWRYLFSIPCAALPVPIEWLPSVAGEPAAIVMQRRSGETIETALSGGSRSICVRAIERALQALHSLHSAGVVHGDLHPGNILVDGAGEVALLDLGLAQSPGSAAAVGAGLPAFAAPERLKGEGVDPRDDLFSLALCGWRALTGKHPYNNYPAMVPGRQDRPQVDSDHPMADLLRVLAAWLSPARELRPDHAEVALREWRALRSDRGTQPVDVLSLAGRPWRWGRWGEPALATVGAGAVLWVTGPAGSGRTGALSAIAAQCTGPVAWVRPSLIAGDNPLVATMAQLTRLKSEDWSYDPHSQRQQRSGSAFSGLGERGGEARSQLKRTIREVRSALGPDGVLLIDDYTLLPESFRNALAHDSEQRESAALVVGAEQAPVGAPVHVLAAVTAEQVAQALQAATGATHDLQVCLAVAEAVGCDRSAILPLLHRLRLDGQLHDDHGRVEAVHSIESLRIAARSAAAMAAGDDVLELPDDVGMRVVLAHLAVAGRCSPAVAGDPAPKVAAGAFAEFGAVRQVAGGGLSVASERHRLWLMEQMQPAELAGAASVRARWLQDRAPLDSLELRVVAASLGAGELPSADEVARACIALTDAAEPARAAAIADDWLRHVPSTAKSIAVAVAAIRAETALGRFIEVDERVAQLPAVAAQTPELQLALADKAFRAGDYPAAAKYADAVVALAGGRIEQAAAAVIKAFAAMWQGDLQAADAAIEAGRKQVSGGSLCEQLDYLNALASYYRGDLQAAKTSFEGLDEASSPAVRAAAAAGVGLCAHRSGDLDQARAAYDASRVLAELAGDRGRILNMTMNIAVLDHEVGDLGRALAGYGRVIIDAQTMGNSGALARSRNNRGNLLVSIGDHERARVDLLAALTQIEEVGNQYLEGNVHCLLAEIARKSAQPVVALDHIDRAIATMNPDDASAELLEWRMERSECLLAGGDVTAADRLAANIFEQANELDNVEMQSRAGWMLARCQLTDSTVPQSLGDLEERLQACATAAVGRKVLLRALIEVDLAAVKAMRGDWAGAAALASDSLARLERIAATLSAADARTFRHGPVYAQRRLMLRLVISLRPNDLSIASTPTIGSAAMGAVLALNRRMSAEHDLARLLEVLMDAAVALTGAERGFLVLDERATPAAQSDMAKAGQPDLRVAIARNLDQENLRKATHKLSWTIAMDVFERGERMVTTDATVDPRFSERASVHAGNLRSILCVPLALQGRTIGVLYVDNRFTAGAFTQDHGVVLEALAAQAAIAIHTARLIARYGRSQAKLQASKTEVDQLNDKLKEQLNNTVEELSCTRAALDAQRLEIERRSDYRQIKGESAQLRRLFGLMDRVRKHDFPVIVVGESGTGKELVARAIHFTGTRKPGPFVAINCGAVPENLLESELFGHKRGAFTGAIAEREGLFVSAHRGTLFLDEVGEMPMSMQVKLLRVLQSGEVQAIGGAALRQVDVRVLAATHRDLDLMVAEGTFREDLLYRLRVVQLHVPALRERTEDLPVLCEHFLAANRAAKLGSVQRISSQAMAIMRTYAWPGNVRELETLLKSACLFADGDVIQAADVSSLVERQRKQRSLARTAGADNSELSGVLHTGTLAEVEKTIIAERLRAMGGNKSRTAQSLGIDRGTLYNKLRKGS